MMNLFELWLNNLKVAWEDRNPDLAASLCAEDILWFESPFESPLRSKKDVLKEWQTVLDQDDIHVKYDVIWYQDGVGTAHWNATFTRIGTLEIVEMDGIFHLKLNADGKCVEFRQWYNTK